MSAIPLIIDTDPALGIWRDGRPRDVDDGLAIIEAINSHPAATGNATPAIDLLGITVTYGNAALTDAFRVAGDLVQLKECALPVCAGAEEAMPQNPDDGPGAETDAVIFLRDTLRARRVRIAAIGPLTNLGVLLARYPDVAGQIDEVVIVAGRTCGNRFYLGTVGPVRDFNFENDVRAARLLLEAGVPIVMAGFELSSRVVVTESDLAAIARRGTPSAEYLHRNSLDWLRYWTKTFPADAGFHPWDSAAIGWFLRPELYCIEKRGWRIRDEALTAQERRHNPDGSPTSVPWLETATELPGPRVTYCTGFQPGMEAEFVRAALAAVY